MAQGSFASMDDMLGMSFDQLRTTLATPASGHIPRAIERLPAGPSAAPSSSWRTVTFMPGTNLSGTSLPGTGLTQLTGVTQLSQAFGVPLGPAQIPDHRQELIVWLVGPGASRLGNPARAAPGVAARTVAEALPLVEGRQDFATFERVELLLRRGERVIVTLAKGDREGKTAQGCRAASLGAWLRQRRTDGAGRPTRETRNEEPLTRKRFTRAQIEAILAFAPAESEGASGEPRRT
jgi:hypothetical protein